MTKTIIDVDGYWSVVLFINVDYDKYNIIASALIDILAPISIIKNIYNKIGYKLNCAVTYNNPNIRKSVVCINKTTSREELINSITHEADHVQACICEYYNIRLDSEDAAYLIGFLVEQFYKSSSRLFCY